MYVGGQPTDWQGGWNGGGTTQSKTTNRGGGGASDIRRYGQNLNDRIIVAGGGGGSGRYSPYNCNGGDGGGPNGVYGYYYGYNNTSYSGQGATQFGGGNGATGGGTNGTLGNGGSGTQSTTSTTYGCGGGGGGYYGGGGGYYYGGGGGGSSWASPAISQDIIYTTGFQIGNGAIYISYNAPLCTSQRVPVIVNAGSIPQPVIPPVGVVCGAGTTLTPGGASYFELFDDAAGTVSLGTGSSFSIPALQTSDTFYIRAYSAAPGTVSQTFNYTGSQQIFVVPAGITSVWVDVRGAQGGSYDVNSGGLGGKVEGWLPVTPGETLYVYVGEQPSSYLGGWNGGGNTDYNKVSNRGGGGASDIRRGGNTLYHRVVVAGGGGGSGRSSTSIGYDGGAGGGLTGGNGFYSGGYNNSYSGQGGTQSRGGDGSLNGSGPGYFGQGGHGYHSSTSTTYGCGGGGGGWFGGGGGYYYGGGGGGSSWADPSIYSVSHTPGTQQGHGSVTITYTPPVCASGLVPVPVSYTPITDPVLYDTLVTCGSPVTIIAQSTANEVLWYDSPVGGNLVASGVGIALPAVTQTQTYYVSNRNQTGSVGSLTFTPCGQTGRFGPSQGQCDAIYGPGVVTVVNGIQQWQVPAGVNSLTIEAWGAQGGGSSSRPGGLGAYVKTEVSVTPGQILNIIVGQGGNWVVDPSSNTGNRGGGGGSFVWDPLSPSEPIIAAGGGGGSNVSTSSPLGVGGSSTTSGTPRADGTGTPGTNGAGAEGGAAGFKSDGHSTMVGIAALAILNGGIGGEGYNASSSHDGGFGGGGGGGGSPSTTHACGGGGGYSGGSGQQGTASVGGGGGGSYAAGTNNVFIPATNAGHGMVRITWNDYSVCESNRVPVQIIVDSLPAPTLSADTVQGCAPVSVNISASHPSAALYHWTDSSGVDIGNGSNILNANIQGPGNLLVTVENAQGCPSKAAQVSLLVTPAPDPTLAINPQICDNAGIVTLQAGTPGGAWNGPGIVNMVNGDFDPASVPPGIHSIVYSVSVNGCNATAMNDVEVLASPDASISSLPATFCSYDPVVTLQALNAGGTWSGSGVSSSGIFDPALVSAVVNDIYYTLTAPNGCQDTDTLSLTVIGVSSVSISPVPSTICNSGGTIQLQAGMPGGTWAGSGVNASTGLWNPAGLAPGNYTISYSITQSGCSASDSVTVQVVNGPDATILTPAQQFCEGSGGTIQLQTTESGGTWSGQGVNASGLFSVSGLLPGSYQVYYQKSAVNCTATDSVTITVNPLPAAVITASSQGICPGGSAQLSVGNGALWQWMYNGSLIAGANSQSYLASQTGQYTVQVTDTNSCSAVSQVLNLGQLSKPEIVSIQAPAVCEGSATQFSQISQVNQQQGALISQWTWDFGTGTSSSPSPQFTFPASGSYNVQLIVQTNQGCTDTLIQTVWVNPMPQLSGLTAPDVCLGSPASFQINATVPSVNGAQIQQVLWNFGDAGTGFGNQVSHVYANPGNYYYQVQAISNQGCVTQTGGNIQIQSPPQALFAPISGICEGQTANFLNLSSAGATQYQWQFGDGNGSTQINPTHAYSASGTYMVNLTAQTAAGCSDTYTQLVQVVAAPSAQFITLNTGSLSRQLSPVSATPGSQYLWTFGDGTSSTDISPLKTWNQSGTYLVCLTIQNQFCSNTFCDSVTVTGSMAITDENAGTVVEVYPNPFTETVTVKLNGWNGENIRFSLRDINGRLVWESLEEPAESMQFNLSSLQLPIGVYVLDIEQKNRVEHIRLIHHQP